MSISRVLVAAACVTLTFALFRFALPTWRRWRESRLLRLFSKSLEVGLRDIEQRMDARLAADEMSTDQLIALVATGDHVFRDEAADVLAERGIDGAQHIEQLAKLLRDHESGARIAAARALAGAGAKARSLVPTIGALLESAQDKQVDTVLQSLQAIGDVTEDLVSVARRILSTSSSDDTRTIAVQLIAGTRRNAPSVRDALLEAIARDAYFSVRMFAAIGLGWLPPDERTTEALRKALDDAELAVRREAESSLARQQNLGKRRPETAEQSASATELAHGQAVVSSLGLGRFVGLGDKQDRDGFTIRTLLVELANGRVVDLPLACVGLRRVMPRDVAERIYERFVCARSELVATSTASPDEERFAQLIEQLTGDAPEDWHLLALRDVLAELALVLDRDERELRKELAERHRPLRGRVLVEGD